MATAHLRVAAEDRRQQILETATELFARQGFRGTTTREIARRAGINEALIFRHFPTKEDLYWAIIDEKCRVAGACQRLQAHLHSEARDRDVFAALADRILRRDTTMTRLLLFSALENHRLSQRFFRTHVARYYEALAEYIRQGTEAGRFRSVDPLLAARGFLGMVYYHFMVQELFGGKKYQQFDPAEVGRTLADIFVQGMLLRDAAPAGPGVGLAEKEQLSAGVSHAASRASKTGTYRTNRRTNPNGNSGADLLDGQS